MLFNVVVAAERDDIIIGIAAACAAASNVARVRTLSTDQAPLRFDFIKQLPVFDPLRFHRPLC